MTILSPDDLRSALSALYSGAPTGIGNAASTQLENVLKSYGAGQQKAAQQQAAALCGYTQKQLAAGRLPGGTTTSVDDFCNNMYTSVALGASGIDPSSQDAIAVFVPANATAPIKVEVPSGKAAVLIPPGAIGQDVTVIISSIPDEMRPLNTAADRQFPYFFEFQTVPVVQKFAQNVVVGVCTNESLAHPEYNMVLAHNVSTTQLEALPPAAPITDCFGPIGMAPPRLDRDVIFSPKVFAASAQAARYLGSRVVDALTPTAAYATNIQLAGSSGSFSPFGGYYPGQYIGLTPSATPIYSGMSGITFSPILPLGADVSCGGWSSSNPKVLAVNSDGVFDAKTVTAATTATVSAVCNGSAVGGTNTDGRILVSYVAHQDVTVNPAVTQ